MAQRRIYDAKTKDHVVKLVQEGKLTVRQASDKYSVQPVQVYSWIGERALRNGDTPPTDETPKPTSAAPDVHTGDTALLRALSEETTGSIDPSLAQVIGEWWIKNRLSKELAKADGSNNQD